MNRSHCTGSLRVPLVSFCATLFCTTSALTSQSQKQLFDLKGGAKSGSLTIAAVGDVNRDGFDDIVVGDPDDGLQGPTTGSVRVFSGSTGRLLFLLLGPPSVQRFGQAVNSAGDVDRDGHPDIVVGGTAHASVFSGKSGQRLYELKKPVHASRGFGINVSTAGDVNRDQHDDLVIGDHDGNMVHVFSGKNQQLLRSIRGPTNSALFGLTVGNAGDANNDGHSDIVVGTPIGPTRSGYVAVHSGKDGALLFQRRGFRPLFAGGDQGVCGVGDVDGDGFDEFCVGAANDNQVLILSPKKQATVHSSFGRPNSRLGISVSRLSDVDRDGVDDVCIGAPRFARILSGKTGKTIRDVTLPISLTSARAVSAAGDVNRDGIQDVMFSIGFRPGSVRVFSSSDLPLVSTSHILDFGQSNGLRLAAGAAQAGRLYLIVGSASGTRPGLQIGSLHLPLNFDSYTNLTLMGVGPPLFQGFLGVLSSSGTATAAWKKPPVTLPPLQLHHAFAVFGPTGLIMTSNAVPLWVK